MPAEIERIRESINELRALASESVPYHTERVARVYRDMGDTILQIFGERSIEYQDYAKHLIKHCPPDPESKVLYPQSQFQAGLPLTIELLEYLVKRLGRGAAVKGGLSGLDLMSRIAVAPPAGLQSVQPPTQRGHEVFVSYSTTDSAFVDELVRVLESQGRRCWIAPRDIPHGVPSWSGAIATAIADSRLVIVVLTVHSIPSIQVIREVTLADNKKISMLPVSLDGTPLSPSLAYFFVASQRLDLAISTPAEQVQSILHVVKQHLLADTCEP
jgi:TIR domain